MIGTYNLHVSIANIGQSYRFNEQKYTDEIQKWWKYKEMSFFDRI